MYVHVEEDGSYILRKIGVMLSMLGIANIWHHKEIDEAEPNSMYVMCDVYRIPERDRFNKQRYSIQCRHYDGICLDITYSTESIYLNQKYDIAITVGNSPVIMYDAENNIIYASDIFHTCRCKYLAVIAVAKLLTAVEKLYPDNIRKEFIVPYLIDMGDYVLDLETGKRCTKAKLGKEIAEEILSILRKESKAWET